MKSILKTTKNQANTIFILIAIIVFFYFGYDIVKQIIEVSSEQNYSNIEFNNITNYFNK